MTWTGQTFSVGQVLTAAQMTTLQADITALANGDSGAPSIQTAAIAADAVTAAKIGTGEVGQSEIAANSVGQSEIKQASQTISVEGQFTATGGKYCLSATLDGFGTFDGGAGSATIYQSNATSSSLIARWHFNVATGGSDDASLQYINSSPPYDMGDGDIPLFVYVVIDNTTGDVIKVSSSPDPVWVYNGPTNCTPDGYDKVTLAPWQWRRDMSGHPLTWAAAQAAGPTQMQDYLEAFREAPLVKEYITQEKIHRDQNYIPHVFDPKPGQTQIMLDPVGATVRDLSTMYQHDEGRNEVNRIVKQHLIIGNTGIGRAGPNNILVPSLRWKNVQGQ